jgi:AraC-like DNA-binding protein
LLYYGILTNRTESEMRKQNIILDKIKGYIHENYQNHDLSLALISRGTGISATTIRDVFVRCIKCSPKLYLNKYRIFKAVEILAELKNNESIDEISEKVGYWETRTFRGNFKKFTKIPPAECRKLLLEHEDKSLIIKEITGRIWN